MKPRRDGSFKEKKRKRSQVLRPGSHSSLGLPQHSWLCELRNSLLAVYLSFAAKGALTNVRVKKGREECMEGGISSTRVIKNPGEAGNQSRKKKKNKQEFTGQQTLKIIGQSNRFFSIYGDLRKELVLHIKGQDDK